MNTLRFNGSLWCNLDIALRALYIQDGQRASDLAQLVGRPATSFTPILDKLQHKGFIERRPDTQDRRVVYIYLTGQGGSLRDRVQCSARDLEKRLLSLTDSESWEAFERILAGLQSMTVDGGLPRI